MTSPHTQKIVAPPRSRFIRRLFHISPRSKSRGLVGVGVKSTPLNIILLGDPAAGKATQSARLVKRYDFFHFDMGLELRRLGHHPSVARKYHLRKTLFEGKMTPTVLARQIILKKLNTAPRSRGILFDGHPKMLGEAQFLERELRKRHRDDPIVIYLKIPSSEIIRRARGRGRSDDTMLALQNRQKYYRKDIRAAVAFYKRRYLYKTVSGAGGRNDVYRRLLALIDRYVDRRLTV